MDEIMKQLIGHVNGLRLDFEGLRGEFGVLRGEFGELRGEFGELRGEFGELRVEVGELRGAVGRLSGDLDAFKDETRSFEHSIRADLKASEQRLALEIVRNHAKMEAMEDRILSAFTAARSESLKILETLQGQHQKVDRRQIIMDYRVDELEKRLKSLEERRDS
jgi:predicted nuclease with TOPRIM domain